MPSGWYGETVWYDDETIFMVNWFHPKIKDD